jgi:hypothetical protein
VLSQYEAALLLGHTIDFGSHILARSSAMVLSPVRFVQKSRDRRKRTTLAGTLLKVFESATLCCAVVSSFERGRH